MADLTLRTKIILIVALLIPPGAAAWLLFQPSDTTASTYAIFTALVIATAAVAVHTWKGAQAQPSTSQLIHETEVAVGARMQPPKR
jgi:ABC-type Mn2+/Zn2+ transport system permease subunit